MQSRMIKKRKFITNDYSSILDISSLASSFQSLLSSLVGFNNPHFLIFWRFYHERFHLFDPFWAFLADLQALSLAWETLNMNKYQKRESRIVREVMNRCYMFQIPQNGYKIVRRNLRKTARILEKRNNIAHKETLTANETAYIRRDLFTTICYARPIEVKDE